MFHAFGGCHCMTHVCIYPFQIHTNAVVCSCRSVAPKTS